MLAQQLVNGIVEGMIYALFAVGFNLIFGVLRLVNLLYGVYFSLGAFIALGLASDLDAPVLVALPLAALPTGLIAVPLDAALFTRLQRKGAPELATLMVSLGMALALYSIATLLLGPDVRRFPFDFIPLTIIEVNGVRVGNGQLLIVAVTILLVFMLATILYCTRFGLAIRAIAQNRQAAELVGIDTHLISYLVSFLSAFMAATAGVLIGAYFNAVHPFMGEGMMLRCFAIVIVGGLGNVRGALVIGLLLGVLEALTAGYISSNLKEAVGFSLMLLTLWFKPTGIFGERNWVKV